MEESPQSAERLDPRSRVPADLAAQVKDALAHLHDLPYLQTHPLTELAHRHSSGPARVRGRALQDCLHEAVAALAPGPGNSTSSAYELLHLRYVEALSVREVCARLGISRAEFYREHKPALAAVVAVLYDRWRLSTTEPHPVIPPAHLRLLAPTLRLGDDGKLARGSRYLTSFIGREADVAAVSQLLAAARLVTLTGTGGCGKTRLALEVAAGLGERFPEGVWLVELTPLADPALVTRAIGEALGIQESTDHSLLATLIDYLRRRRVLLILDNCEHLIAECARVVEALVRGCERLHVLATSRELLGVAGEAIWRVPSLSTVAPCRLKGSGEKLLAAVQATEAARLFVDRARLVAPSFALTPRNAMAVAQVCHRLDGIPLAIELAAARVAVLSVEQLAARLDQRFRLLDGGSRTAVRRQQTLRATIDWSYQLLTEEERSLLRRLAVFAGGWSLEAAEVLGGENALDILSGLVAKSMVLVEEPGENGLDEVRYRLSETIRQYAEEKLDEAGETAWGRTRLRDWCVRLAEQAMPGMEGPEQRRWFDRLEAERGNLRAALALSASDPDGADALVQLAGLLGYFWIARGPAREGKEWLETALSTPGAAGSGHRARALSWLGQFVRHDGDRERGRRLLEESATLARSSGDRRLLSHVLRHLSLALLETGDIARARQLIDEALAVSREAGVKREVADNLNVLSDVLQAEGARAPVEPILVESLAVGRESGDLFPVCQSLRSLAYIRLVQGDFTRTRAHFYALLAHARTIDFKFMVCAALCSLGDIATAQGLFDEALGWYWQGLYAGRGTPLRVEIVYVLRRYADALAQRGDHRLAVRLTAATSTFQLPPNAWVAAIGPLQSDETLAAARQALGDEAFETAWAEGETMPLEDAVELVLTQGYGGSQR